MQMQNNFYTISRKSMLLFLQLSTTIVIGFFGVSEAAKRTTVVQTASGPVQGLIRTTGNSVKYAAFTGIPFAKPPLADLRFKPPVDPDSWTEVYAANTTASDCIQYNSEIKKVLGDEDCLYINIATRMRNLKKAPTKSKAVVVFVYGGGFLVGSSAFSIYRPDYFLEKDCIYVSLNYRTGAFGFMSLNHPNATGNAGLKDLVHGLKWVQKNIAKFGGDPKKVTIMGGSAGGASVGYLVLSNSAAGLFRGSISMSGAPLNPWTFQSTSVAVHQAHVLINKLGIKYTDPDSTLEALYNVPARDIVIATSNLSKTFGSFTPTLENKLFATEPLLTECAVDKYLTGRFNQVPQIIGYDDQETVSMVKLPTFCSELIDNCIVAAKMYHMHVPESIMAAKERCNGNLNSCDHFSYKELRKFINESTDLMFKAGIDQTQKFLSNGDSPIYYYDITFYTRGPHLLDMNNSLPGAGHGDDIRYLFYNPTMNRSTELTGSTARTTNRMVTMWTNFIKYGNPTPDLVDDDYDLGITWPNSGPLGITLEIGNELTIKPKLLTRDLEFDERSMRPYLREATGCDCN